MARCETGYLCDVCHGDVEGLADSSLYLRYVLGEVDARLLDRLPERHLGCDPLLAQFIRTEGFPTPVLEGPFARSSLDPDFVRAEEERVTRGYERLLDLARRGAVFAELPIAVGDGRPRGA